MVRTAQTSYVPTLANMRKFGCRDVLIYCRNAPRCHHSGKMNADAWPDDTPFAEIERRMVCTWCGIIGAELRPNWSPHTACKGKIGV